MNPDPHHINSNIDVNQTIFDMITQKYQPSPNEKVSRVNHPPVQGVSALPPRIVRSQSANDAPGVGYNDYHLYGDQYAAQDQDIIMALREHKLIPILMFSP